MIDDGGPAPDDASPAIDAGEFGAWVLAMTAALRGSPGTAVPCGDCVGCCSSFWPVALRADDPDIDDRLPADLVHAAPAGPPGLRYLYYRPDGTCPLLTDHRCTVYERRPQTCRDFDCRLFTATGLDSAGPGKALIDRRITAWRFRYASPEAERVHRAMRAAASFLTGPARSLAVVRPPTSPIAIAGLAFKAYTVFLDPDIADESVTTIWQRMIAAGRAFDADDTTLPAT
jgi:Fe-S-cluster containining protein